MSASSPKIQNLEDLFVYNLEIVYDMEMKLVDALDEMSQLTTNENLSAGFAIHRTETETQVRRVEVVFEALGTEPTQRDSLVTDGLLAENEQFDANIGDNELRNLHYLTAGIKTERIEITSYEGLLTTAKKANLRDDVTTPLEDTLRQEEKTLRKLQGFAGKSNLKSLWNEVTGL